MFHLAAFYESLDPAAAETKITAVADQAIRTDGDDLVVPSGVSNLVAEAALSAATGPAYGKVTSPSLRQLADQYVDPIVAAVLFGANPAVQRHFNLPRALKAAESLNFEVNATGGAAAANYGLVWLSDGPLGAMSGNVFSIRGTCAVTAVTGEWVNGSITFTETLPAGTYNVVGMRAQEASTVAARLVFVGGAFRPGVPAVNAVGDQDFPEGRYGRMGSFGVFDVNQPPTLDVLAASGAVTVDVVLDLIKVS